jgi:limonene-1,2-epoxide hydrolase
MSRSRSLALALLMLTLVGCASNIAGQEDPAWVVEKFLAARQARNLDAAMDCFVEQPEIRTSLGIAWAGRDQVRAIVAYRLTDTYTVGEMRIAGNRATWSEHVRRSVAGSPVAMFDEDVEAVVMDGHITSLMTYVGGAHPPSAVDEAKPARLDLLVPLSTLVLVAAAVMVWPAPPPPLHAPRVASGQLLNGLRDYVARRG